MTTYRGNANNTYASDNDASSHEKAGGAHYDAKWKNEQAGNATQAKLHQRASSLHHEKADSFRRTERYASDEATAAEKLSQKAGKAAFGKDPDELRSEKQLHGDAATAHGKAAKAFEMAGKPADAAYHSGKAAEHQACCDGKT